jgi:nicotinamidase-related amidase
MPAAVHRSFSSSLINPPEDSNSKKPEDNSQAQRCGLGSDMGSDRGHLLMAGEWNTQLYSPLHEASDKKLDIFCAKNRISGLWTDDTPLAKALQHQHYWPSAPYLYRTLLFAGVNTDQCVLGTLVDAYNRGFDCIMLEDCCATKTPGGEEVTALNVSVGFLRCPCLATYASL